MGIPAGTTVRLYLRPGSATPYLLLLAARGGAPSPEAVSHSVGATARLTHDAGVAWPNRHGAALMLATLERGGNVVLAFRAMADALACQHRLRGLLVSTMR